MIEQQVARFDVAMDLVHRVMQIVQAACRRQHDLSNVRFGERLVARLRGGVERTHARVKTHTKTNEKNTPRARRAAQRNDPPS